MSRYIDADALKQNLKENYVFYGFVYLLNDFYVAIDEEPFIDIVRCRECKYAEYRADYNDYECHYSGCGLVYEADDFCSNGERKSDESVNFK